MTMARHHAQFACSLALVLTFSAGCGDDTTSNDGSSDETSTGGAETMQVSSGAGDDDDDDDDSLDTTLGDDDDDDVTTSGTTGNTDSDSDSGSDSDGTTTEGSTTGTTGSTGSTGTTTDDPTTGTETGGMMVGFGDCLNAPEAEACLAEEECTSASPAGAVCTWSDCADVGECPLPPPGGDATLACVDVAGVGGMPDGVDECALLCDMGQTCPDGMVCGAGLACVWPPEPAACTDDEDLGSTVPQVQDDDSNVGAGNDAQGSCGGDDGEDYVYSFTVPEDGLYLIDTLGSTYDTVLYAVEGPDCGGSEIDCVDDFQGDFQSLLVLDLMMGQQISIVVDAFDAGETGDIMLTITNVPAGTDGGSCCTGDSGVPGCDVPEVETCVCIFDDFCCGTEWDDVCVDQALDPCTAVCM